MSGRQKRELFRIVTAGVVTLVLAFMPLEAGVRLWLCLIPYMIVGWDVLYMAVRNLLRGQLLDEQFLMAAATVGAFVLGEYLEAVAVMLFYQVGELFQSIAVGRSRRNIAALMDIRPESARVLRDGKEETVAPEEVEPGEHIRIFPGERVPLDGEVTEGRCRIDTAALTGESLPREAEIGDTVLSGTVNLDGVITVCVKGRYEDSTVARLLELVENVSARKARTENFITRFAHWYTPCVVVGAVLLGLIPSLLTGEVTLWVGRALTFLVVSCPCALVISVPLTFFGGIGGAAHRGILIKGAGYLERLSSVDTVVMDKTGTLTRGIFRVVGRYPAEGVTESELMEAAALAEQHSTHPVAAAVREAWPCTQESGAWEITENGGMGVEAESGSHRILCGNARLMEQGGISYCPREEAGSILYVARDGKYLGALSVADEIKPEAAEALQRLRRAGVNHLVMLTGDRRAMGESVAAELGIDDVRCELLPADKVRAVEGLLRPGNTLAYVGDGINDAPVLARADIGIAMGALGSDVAIEAADVVLMDDKLTGLSDAVGIARRTMRIVWQNLLFTLLVKPLVLILSVFGFANMWMAIFADVGVLILAVLNAMRSIRPGRLPSAPHTVRETAKSKKPVCREN